MTDLLSEAEVTTAGETLATLEEGLAAVIFGQDQLIRLVLTGFFAGGHLLLEGLPGLGKTELVKALAALSGLEHRRIQFTPDLLPGDITGTQVLEEGDGGRRHLVFRPGPVFGQIVLADEINRASPKTQSALLEAMQEHNVTVLDTTHHLPAPFFVLATQNPVELDGTYPLPEAQLDRFMLKCSVTGVDAATLARIVRERPDGRPPAPAPRTDAVGILELMATAQRVAVPEAVAGYIARLVQATRPELPDNPAIVRENVRWGASPRAALALAACGRAAALLHGRPAVGFADVRDLAAPVLCHRLIMSYEAGIGGVGAEQVVAALCHEIPELPA